MFHLFAYLFNENPHLGAIAVGEYCRSEQRTSCSVITRPGHKDDVIAAISQVTQQPVCVMAGIHLDDILFAEIRMIKDHCDILVKKLLELIKNELIA